jgi:hypothetical protein
MLSMKMIFTPEQKIFMIEPYFRNGHTLHTFRESGSVQRKCSIQSSTEENIETVKRQMEDKPQLFGRILILDDSVTAERYRNNILGVFITQLQLAQGYF